MAVKSFIVDSLQFTCELLDTQGQECKDKAAYRETVTQLRDNQNSSLFLCDNHFFEFKLYWEKDNPKGFCRINRRKIKAREQIEHARMLKAAKKFAVS